MQQTSPASPQGEEALSVQCPRCQHENSASLKFCGECPRQGRALLPGGLTVRPDHLARKARARTARAPRVSVGNAGPCWTPPATAPSAHSREGRLDGRSRLAGDSISVRKSDSSRSEWLASTRRKRLKTRRGHCRVSGLPDRRAGLTALASNVSCRTAQNMRRPAYKGPNGHGRVTWLRRTP